MNIISIILAGLAAISGANHTCSVNNGAFFGDSIAQGTYQAAGKRHHQVTKVGISAKQLRNKDLPANRYDWVVISAGVNNPSKNIENDLLYIRQKMLKKTNNIIWIVPEGNAVAKKAVMAISKNDYRVTYKAGKDGVHPRSYQKLWSGAKSHTC